MIRRFRLGRWRFFKSIVVLLSSLAGVLSAAVAAEPASGVAAEKRTFRAGAAVVDIAPRKFPVIVNGYTFERTASRVVDRLSARALVLDDGAGRLALVVVDLCVIPRSLVDRAKQLASQATGIPPQRMLVSATHTHSAPSAMPALGSREDKSYAEYLPGRIAEALVRANHNLTPARVGWTVTQDRADTHCRLWIMRPGKVPDTPFGESGKRILMVPPYAGPDNIGPAGPVDTGLTLLSLQSLEGRPLALLANFGMHFCGAPVLSSDWCGQFAEKMEQRLGRSGDGPPPVAIMSQGSAGDQHWMDFSRPVQQVDYVNYGKKLAEAAYAAYEKIQYHDWAPLAMGEKRLTLAVRAVPPARLAWARSIVATMGDRMPRTRPEVYAREQVLYSQTPPTRELKLQALRVGELGITAIPCEVYGLTGLKLKARSPLTPTMNIELANGEEGYLPPPEQHALGGYSTWEARTSCLETGAEPKIVEAVLGLLEEVAGKPRRVPQPVASAYAAAVRGSRPVAYWRFQDMQGPAAQDALGRHPGSYENGVAFYLEGPPGQGLGADGRECRAAHFAGGRMTAALPDLGDAYSVELWLWQGLANDASNAFHYFFSRGSPNASDAMGGDSLKIDGGPGAERLAFSCGIPCNLALTGKTPLAPRTWHHVALVRDGKRVSVYLNGNPKPEIAGKADFAAWEPGQERLFFGGWRKVKLAGLEGKLSEAAVYSRALAAEEIVRHYQAAKVPTATAK